MSYQLGQTVGVKILEALGLPSKKCLGLTIEVMPDQVVVAKVSYAVDADGLTNVMEIVQRLKPEAQA